MISKIDIILVAAGAVTCSLPGGQRSTKSWREKDNSWGCWGHFYWWRWQEEGRKGQEETAWTAHLLWWYTPSQHWEDWGCWPWSGSTFLSFLLLSQQVRDKREVCGGDSPLGWSSQEVCRDHQGCLSPNAGQDQSLMVGDERWRGARFSVCGTAQPRFVCWMG